MRHILIIVLILLATPCLAQWKQDPENIEVVAFGVHDTSLFYSEDHSMERINPTGKADAGLDFTQGNFTTFASAGPNFFAGSDNADDGGVAAMSTNNGSSWKSLPAGGPIGSNGTYVFADYAYKLARSTDSGATWQHLSYPDGTSYVGTGAAVFLYSSSYWRGTSSAGFWRSLDSGYTWSKPSSQPPFLGTLVNMGTVLFLYEPIVLGTPWLSSNGLLLCSRDSGVHWDTVHTGVAPWISALATDGRNLFIGGLRPVGSAYYHSLGVLVSTDTGRTWRAANDGITELANGDSSMIVEAFGVYDSSLYASFTSGQFPYRSYHRPLKELIDTTPSAVRKLVPVDDSILVYPNPASGQLSILAGGTFIFGVHILNVLGEGVLSTEYRVPSVNALSLDISKLPSGTYFLRIETKNGTALRKITITR